MRPHRVKARVVAIETTMENTSDLGDSKSASHAAAKKKRRRRRNAARRRGIESLEGAEDVASTTKTSSRRKKKAALAEDDAETVFVVWYRWSDLRLTDHEPLVAAEKAASKCKKGRVLHLHVVEQELVAGRSRVAGIRRCSLRRALFWCESVEALGSRLSACTYGQQQLLVACASNPSQQPQHAHHASVVEVFRSVLTRVAASGARIGGVYAHQAFCDEEVQTEGRLRSLLARHAAAQPVAPDLHVLWGGQSMHHIDDLGIELETTTTLAHGTQICMRNPDRMPQFKGEFNKLCKGKRLRAPLRVPYHPATAVASSDSVGSAAPSVIRELLQAGGGGGRGGGDGVEIIGWAPGTSRVRAMFESLLGLPPGADALQASVRQLDPDAVAAAWPENGHGELNSGGGGGGRQRGQHAKHLPFGKTAFLYPPRAGAGVGGGGACTRWPGGETAALAYLRQLVWETDPPALALYKGATESFNHRVGAAANTPVNAGTRLSPWLAFGNLSVRTVMAEVKKWERQRQGATATATAGNGQSGGQDGGQDGPRHGSKHGGKSGHGGGRTNYGRQVGRVAHSVAPTRRLYQELVFRDFLRISCLKWGADLFRVHGPFRVQGLIWRRPGAVPVSAAPTSAGSAASDFRRWQQGRTGFPFVDAGMRELALTGYMSHLHRQCCAAFLARDLRIDWRCGAEHFEACLLDHTPDANWGNWAYRILPRPCLVPGLRRMTAAGEAGVAAELRPFAGAAAGGGSGGSGGSGGNRRRRGKKKASAAPQPVSPAVPPPAVPPAPGATARVRSEHEPAMPLQLTCAQTQTQTTVECTVWPLIHDSFAAHTLAWIPELRRALWRRRGTSTSMSTTETGAGRDRGRSRSSGAGRDASLNLDFELAREPWRDNVAAAETVGIRPYRDSPLWFCAANRASWAYEYGWFSGRGVRVTALAVAAARAGEGEQQEQKQKKKDNNSKNNRAKAAAGAGVGAGGDAVFCLGRDYPFPLVMPVAPSLCSYDELPVQHCWSAGAGMDADIAEGGLLEPISPEAAACVERAVAFAIP